MKKVKIECDDWIVAEGETVYMDSTKVGTVQGCLMPHTLISYFFCSVNFEVPICQHL